MARYTREHVQQAKNLIAEWEPKVRDGSAPVVDTAERTVELRPHPLAEALSAGFTEVVGRPKFGGQVLALTQPTASMGS